MNSQGRVGKGVNPLKVTRYDTMYFDVLRLHKLLGANYKGPFNARLMLIMCCIASSGIKGCTTYDLIGLIYSDVNSVNLRSLNRSIVLLCSSGLLVRNYRRVFLSVHAEKLLSGKL